MNEKKRIIDANKDNELFKKCLVFLLDGNITTGIKDSKLRKVESATMACNAKIEFNDFEEVMEYLKVNNTGRDEDIANIKSFIYGPPMDDDEFNFYTQMITKKYRLGADKKLVNKCIPGLIPTFDVMLGTPLEKCKLKGDEKIFLSKKLNGCRAAFIGDKIMTRQGKEYTGLTHIIEDLQDIVGTEMFVDGELLYKNKEGLSDSDSFQRGTGIAMSKDADKSSLKMVVFDMFPLKEFKEGRSNSTYGERKLLYLCALKNRLTEHGTDNIEVVPMCYEGTDHSEIWKWLDKAEDMDWEGIVCNLDTPYECKRTKNLIKIKKFKEIDLRCIDVNIAESGKYKGLVGSITCKFGDYTVDVGSGFDDDKRRYYAEYPEEIIGRIITIKYKEETHSKTGEKSLQFPVLISVRYDKDVADDEI